MSYGMDKPRGLRLHWCPQGSCLCCSALSLGEQLLPLVAEEALAAPAFVLAADSPEEEEASPSPLVLFYKLPPCLLGLGGEPGLGGPAS